MLGAASLALSAVAIGVAAGLLASCLRLDRLVPFLLAAYLVASTELGLSAILLTPVHGIGRTGLVASSLAWLAVGVAAWLAADRPRPPALRPRLAWLAHQARRPTVGVLLTTVGVAYAYLAALAVATPQNEEDALTYHLSRAALWVQSGGIRTFGTVADPRVDGNPILAELGQAWLMGLAGSERAVWATNGAAVVALSLGAFALARRAGVEAGSALLAGLLVPTLPVVALQAGTGMNDLIVASFLVAAAVFATGEVGRELVVLGLACALAIATKFNAPFLLPLVALAALVAQPRRRLLPVLGVMAAGVAAGSAWYVVNWERTGSLDGGLAAWAGQTPVRTVPTITANVERLLLDAVEAPGMQGLGSLAYLVVGLALVGAGLAAHGRRPSWRGLVAAGVVVASLPLVLFGGSELLGEAFGALWDLRGETGFATEMRQWTILTVPDATRAWFGPLGVLATLLACAAALVAVRRGSARLLALLLAVTPLLGVLLLAVAVTYDPWRGRMLVAPWVMGVAAWSLVARRYAGELALTAAACLTLALCVVGFLGKPLGASWLTGRDVPSVWSLSRWEVQTLVRAGGAPMRLGSASSGAGEAATIRAVEQRVPETAPLAVLLGENDFVFPYVGRTLRRPLTLLNAGEPVPREARWLVVSPGVVPRTCAADWRVVLRHPGGWRLLRRAGAASCDASGLLRPVR